MGSPLRSNGCAASRPVLQAAAPLIFGAALTAWGLAAIWLTAGLGVGAILVLLALRRT